MIRSQKSTRTSLLYENKLICSFLTFFLYWILKVKFQIHISPEFEIKVNVRLTVEIE